MSFNHYAVDISYVEVLLLSLIVTRSPAAAMLDLLEIVTVLSHSVARKWKEKTKSSIQ